MKTYEELKIITAQRDSLDLNDWLIQHNLYLYQAAKYLSDNRNYLVAACAETLCNKPELLEGFLEFCPNQD